MREHTYGDRETDLGRWQASIKTGRKAILVVQGLIPTNGKNQLLSLQVADSQHADPWVLVLQLKPDLAVLGGPDETEVYYAEVIDRYDQYESVLVNGNGRTLAFFDIKKEGSNLEL